MPFSKEAVAGNSRAGLNQPLLFSDRPNLPPYPFTCDSPCTAPGADSALSSRVSQARRAASTSANRSSLGASQLRVPLREEVRALVNVPAGHNGGGGQTRAAREDPRRSGAGQTPGRGRRRAPGMRISRHWGRGAGPLGNRASLGDLRWSLEKTVLVVKIIRYEVKGAFCETKYSPDKS